MLSALAALGASVVWDPIKSTEYATLAEAGQALKI